MNTDQLPLLVDRQRCSGCGRCVAACAERLFSLETCNYRKYAVLSNPQHCTRCGACISACVTGAISLTPDYYFYRCF